MEPMRGVRIAVTIGALALAGAAAAAGALSPASPAKHCKAGSTSATIAGKHVCLRPGGRCTKRLDARYHRYRFHCHCRPTDPLRKPGTAPAAPPTLSEPPAPTGRLVDVGGYRILSSARAPVRPPSSSRRDATAPRLAVRKVQYALAADTRVCSYDRPHRGASVGERPATGRASLDVRDVSRELRTVLANAGERGPYLLAAHSFGGLLVSAFTRAIPTTWRDSSSSTRSPPRARSRFATPGVLPEVWDARADVALIDSASRGDRGPSSCSRPPCRSRRRTFAGAARTCWSPPRRSSQPLRLRRRSRPRLRDDQDRDRRRARRRPAAGVRADAPAADRRALHAVS